MGHFEKCRDILESIGNKQGVLAAESHIMEARSELERGNKEHDEEKVEKQQALYEQYVKSYGRKDAITINAGLNLATALQHAGYTIDAERLFREQVAISKQAHGPDHQLTKHATFEFEYCKERYAEVNYNNQWNWYQVLRYEDDGKKCVVQGPFFSEPRNVEEEETLTVAIEDLIYDEGTPVTCHGLEGSMSDLNGNIGDVRSWNEETGCYEVNLEDNIEPCFVKPKNIRILFELPDE